MNITVEFYETKNGECPVWAFLDDLKRVIQTTLRLLSQGWQSCGTGSITGSRCQRQLGEGLFELRHVGKLNTRVLWFFVKDRRIVAVHSIRNEGQAIPGRDIRIARECMGDWQKRAMQ